MMRTKVLCIAATLLLTVQGAWAQDATLIDGVYYVLNNEEKTAEVVEPKGFKYQGDIVVPDTVKQDGTDYAVTALGEGAFFQANLTSLQLPKKTLRIIGPSAFTECSGVTVLDIPEGVTTIGNYALGGDDFTRISIPASVTEMGLAAVGSSPELESVTVAEGNTHFGIFDGVLMDKAQTRLICYPAKMAGKTYTVPTTVTSFDRRAFQYLAFLTSVTIPTSVSELKYEMFYMSSSLEEINIDPANTAYCSADGVVYTADKETLLIYPAGKTTKFYTLDFPVKTIGSSAFTHATHLQTVAIPKGVTTIRDAAFYSCTSLQKVSFPESITEIETSAFGHCESLESIILPPNITEIPTVLFFQCTSLRSVTIPAGVTNIGMTPFLLCPSLTEITCLATTPPTLHAMAFSYLAQADITLYVPEEAVETYKATPVWKNFNVQAITGMGIVPMSDVRSKMSDVWYTLDGRRINGRSAEERLQGKKPTQRGIYINGGRKVVLK
ncbi:MAG: leucine-rich repeat domain-containing protein [Bacteroidales bacterium]|nr:leucine-rich repeat domain-containing protein [Bacteroidales bacterium]